MTTKRHTGVHAYTVRLMHHMHLFVGLLLQCSPNDPGQHIAYKAHACTRGMYVAAFLGV